MGLDAMKCCACFDFPVGFNSPVHGHGLDAMGFTLVFFRRRRRRSFFFFWRFGRSFFNSSSSEFRESKEVNGLPVSCSGNSVGNWVVFGFKDSTRLIIGAGLCWSQLCNRVTWVDTNPTYEPELPSLDTGEWVYRKIRIEQWEVILIQHNLHNNYTIHTHMGGTHVVGPAPCECVV
jgi:hypothetical protein